MWCRPSRSFQVLASIAPLGAWTAAVPPRCLAELRRRGGLQIDWHLPYGHRTPIDLHAAAGVCAGGRRALLRRASQNVRPRPARRRAGWKHREVNMHIKNVRPYGRIRRAAAITLALGLAATTAACSAGGGGTQGGGNAAGGEHAEVNYWDMQWGSPTFMNQLKDNVKQFNKEHKNIQVKFQQLAWGDYSQKLLSAVQAGNPPDIGGGDSGIPFNMDAQGQALDITDLYQEWQGDGTIGDMVPWAYQKWDYNGKRPGATWQFDIRAIFYRKDLLQQAGIQPPTTWDELLAAAKKLTNADKSQIGIAAPGKQGSYDTDQ